MFIFFCAASAQSDTLWLSSGEVLVCSDLKSETNDIVELVTSGYDTVSGKNLTTCDGATYGIDRVFAKQNKDGYFLRYHTGFVKRVTEGRISFYKGTMVSREPYKNDDEYDPAPKKTGVKFYSIDNTAPHRLRGRIDATLKKTLSSYEPSHTMLRKAKGFYITGSIIGGAGGVMLGLVFLNVFRNPIPPILGVSGVIFVGGSLILTGELCKKTSVDLFNESTP